MELPERVLCSYQADFTINARGSSFSVCLLLCLSTSLHLFFVNLNWPGVDSANVIFKWILHTGKGLVC